MKTPRWTHRSLLGPRSLPSCPPQSLHPHSITTIFMFIDTDSFLWFWILYMDFLIMYALMFKFMFISFILVVCSSISLFFIVLWYFNEWSYTIYWSPTVAGHFKLFKVMAITHNALWICFFPTYSDPGQQLALVFFFKV